MPELGESALDTLLLNIMSCFAEFEREMIATRIAEERDRLISRKQSITSAMPFGYTTDDLWRYADSFAGCRSQDYPAVLAHRRTIISPAFALLP